MIPFTLDWRLIVIAGAIVAVIGGAWWLRYDAATDERNSIAAGAAVKREEVMKNAQSEADAAVRDGLRERLRRGEY